MTQQTTKRRPRVYVLAEPSHRRDGEPFDLRPLATHGDLFFVCRSGHRPTSRPDTAYAHIFSKLSEFDSTQGDSLAWVGGDMLAVLLAGVALRELGYVGVPWLRWQRSKHADGTMSAIGEYVRLWISFPETTLPDTAVPHALTPSV